MLDRTRARDLASVSRFHAEPIGQRRGRTPDGYMVLYDVPLARTGWQDYAGWEIEDPAITPSEAYRVERADAEVFHPDSIASWHGKAVTNDHPPEMLSPACDAQYRVGTMVNPRRGEGSQSDLLLVDMMITCPRLEADIESGKKEVSGGYDCDYFETAPGRLQQRNIRGNHGAVVDRGRCGHRCAIGDQTLPEIIRETRAKAPTRRRSMRVLETLRRALKSGTQATIDKAVLQAILDSEGEEEGKVEGHSVHIHVGGQGESAAGREEVPPKKEDPMDAAPEWFKEHHKETGDRWAKHDEYCKGMDEWRGKVDAFMKGEGEHNDEGGERRIEGELEEEAPPGTALNDRSMRDSAILVDSHQATCAGAEVLAPGIELPRLDRGAPAAKTFDAICKLRRAALDRALASADGRQAVLDACGGRPLDTAKATCAQVRGVFHSAVAIRRAQNAAGGVRSGAPVVQDQNGYRAVGGVSSIAELNALNAKIAAESRTNNLGRR